jgi:hypothetical protein
MPIRRDGPSDTSVFLPPIPPHNGYTTRHFDVIIQGRGDVAMLVTHDYSKNSNAFRGATLFTSLIWRTVVVVAATIAGMPVFAQSETSEAAPAPAASLHEFLSRLPPGSKPKPGHGELLQMKTAGGLQVVQLHCALDPLAMVMLPTGELDLVQRAKAKATTNPFVAATPEELQASLKAAGFSKFKFEKGQFYFYAYDCSDGFFMHAQSILNSMLSGVVENLKSLGLKVKRPDVPMVVVIMPSRKAFDDFHAMPKEVAAYYDMMSNRVIMYEDQELWDAAPEYAAKKAGYVVAHESIHQLLMNVGVQSRLSNWPAWIREGIAEYYCPLKVNSTLIHKDKSDLPTRTMKWSKAGMVNDLRMRTLLKTPPKSGRLIEQLVSAEDIDANGYALAWGLVHYLINKKPDDFRAYLADISKYEPLDEATAMTGGKPDAMFVKHFGDDFDKLERDLQAYLTSKKMQSEYVDPIENQTFYIVKSVEKKGRAFENRTKVTTSPAGVKKFKEEVQTEHPGATITTIICKNKAEVDRQLRLMK